MKIIDLLNKIANGEEIPKKIKYKDKIYEYKEYDVYYGKIMTKTGWVKEYDYVAEENRTYYYLKHCYQNLSDEVEILEEKKIPEKLNYIYPDISCSYNESELLLRIEANKDKINEIIDYLKSKGD